ncbi:hypothetical protein EGT07_18210 [Herbaspirillum sp. HC18]|nr:hypothetical protein EGT07_18210 [Herbaspirillum sp. HC18]
MAGLIDPMAATDFQIQQQAVDRKRKLAELLQYDSLKAPEGQTVGGRFVAPSPTQYLAKLAQGLMAMGQQKTLDEEQRNIASQQEKFFGDQADALHYALTPRAAVSEQNFGPGDDHRNLSYMEHTDAPAPDVIRKAEPAFTPTQSDMTSAIVKYLNSTGNSTKAADYVVSDAKNQMLANALRGITPSVAPAPQTSQQPAISSMPNVSAPNVGVAPSQPVVGGAVPISSDGLAPQNAYQFMDPQQKSIVDGYFSVGKSEEAIKYMADALKPHMSSDGKMMVYRGGRAVVVPGSVDAFGQFKREEKQYDAPVSLNTESGATVQLSPTEWSDYQRTGNLPLRFLPENMRAGLQAEADASGSPGRVNIKTPQGIVGGEIVPRIGISQTTAGKQQQEKQGTFFGDTYADLQKKGMVANDTIAKYQRLSSLLEGIETGKSTGTALEIKKAAKAAGIDLGVADNVAPLEAARALTSEMALMARNPDSGMGMPGSMSDADRNFLINMQPGIETTPEGRRLQIQALMKMEQRKQEIAKLAREYKNGQLDNGFFQVVQDYANANPLFADTTAPKASAAPTSKPKDVYDEFGLERRAR